MSRAPYQYIPTAVYDEDERRKKADAWAEQHRAALAAQWRDLHAQDAADLLRQHGLDEMGMPLGSDPNVSAPNSTTFAPNSTTFAPDTTTAVSPADSFPPPSPAPAADVLQKVGDAGGLAPPSFDEVMQKATLPGEGISDAAMTRTLTGEPPPEEQRSPFDLPTPDLPGLPLNGPRVLPPQLGKPTQIGDEQRDKMLRGEPLTGQDVVSQFTKASNNNQFQSSPAGLAGGGDLDQILHPRLADLAGAPGVHLGTSEEDLARGFAQGVSEGAGLLGDARSAAEAAAQTARRELPPLYKAATSAGEAAGGGDALQRVVKRSSAPSDLDRLGFDPSEGRPGWYYPREDSPLKGIVRRVIDTSKVAADDSDELGRAGYLTGGRIEATHVTDNPRSVLDVLERGESVAEARPTGDLGPGLYASDAPDLWMNRSSGKWDFTARLTPDERTRLADAAATDLERKAASRYIDASEHEAAQRDIDAFRRGDDDALRYLAGQPYNVEAWTPAFLERVGIAPGTQPQQVPVVIKGRIAELDYNPRQSEVEALRAAGFAGAYTRSGMGSYPQLVVWSNDAVKRFGPYEAAGAFAGFGVDENGDISFDPAKAALGVAAGTVATDKRVQGAARRFFHGTGSAFDRPDPKTFKQHGTFGPGYYLTDHPLAAETFALARSETRDAAEGSLQSLRQQLAEATDPGLRRSLERDIARVEGDAAVKPGGPNIRAVDVPEGLRLFDAHDATDADAVAVQSELARALGLDPWEDRAKLTTMGVSRVGGDGARMWRAVRQALGGDAEAANDLFARAGFDGIAFDGSRYGLDAPDGAPIQNEALVVFPGSMEKLRNAISGTPFGGFSPAGAAAGMQVGEDENGRPTLTGYDPVLGAVAMVAGTLGTKEGRRSAAQLVETGTHVAASMTESDRLKMREFKQALSPVQPWIDRAQAVRYAAMLANVVGRVADVGVGAVHTVELPVLDALAGLHGDRVLLGAAKERARATVAAIPEAFKAAADIVLSSDPERSGRLEGGASRTGRPFGNGPVGRAVNLVPDLMAASDDFFKTINGAGAAYAEAYKIATRTGQDVVTVLENPSQELAERVVRAGEYVTYTGDPGGLPKWLGDGARQPGPTGFLISLAIPFVKVGANIASRGAKATVAPVIGPVEAAFRAAKGDPEAARYALARTEVAAGLGLLWWSQWAAGNLTGGGPQDPEANAQWRRQGNVPNSIKVLGQPVPLAQLGAPGAHAIVLANAFENAARTPPLKAQRKLIASGGSASVRDALVVDPETERFLQQWIAGAADGLADISYLKQVADLFKKGPTDPGFVARTASSFAGGDVLNRVGEATDPLERETARDGWVAQAMDTLKSRAPGLRQALPPKQDPLGHDLENPSYARVVPGRQPPSPVLDAASEAGVKIGSPPDSVSVDGVSVPLSRTEQRAYQRYAGEVLERYVHKKTAEPAWDTYDAARRRAIIKDVQKAAHEAAAAKVQKDIGAAELKRRIREVRGVAPQPIR